MSYTPKNNFNLQLKRTDAGEIGFRKKLLKDVTCCDETDYQFYSAFNGDHILVVGTSGEISISVKGGCTSFSWTVSGSVFVLGAASTVNRTNTITAVDDAEVPANSLETVTVIDNCGNSASILIRYCGHTTVCTDVITDGTQWIEKAPRLNTQDWICSMLIFNDELYGSTSAGGRLFKWNGSDAWIQVAGELEWYDDDISGIVELGGKIYGATSDSGALGGRLLEWNGVDAWTLAAPKLNTSAKSISSLCVFNGKIYGGASDGGYLLEWNEVDAWALKASTLNSQYHIYSLCVFNNKLYGGTSGGRLFRWNDINTWEQVAPQYSTTTSIYSLCIFNNKLYGSSYQGVLLEWNGTDAWTEAAPLLGGASHIDSLCVFNNKLYGGAYGYLLEWNGTDAWTEVAPRYNGISYDRICSMIVFNNQLYGSVGRWSAGAGGLLLMWDSTFTTVCE